MRSADERILDDGMTRAGSLNELAGRAAQRPSTGRIAPKDEVGHRRHVHGSERFTVGGPVPEPARVVGRHPDAASGRRGCIRFALALLARALSIRLTSQREQAESKQRQAARESDSRLWPFRVGKTARAHHAFCWSTHARIRTRMQPSRRRPTLRQTKRPRLFPAAGRDRRVPHRSNTSRPTLHYIRSTRHAFLRAVRDNGYGAAHKRAGHGASVLLPWLPPSSGRDTV